MKIWKRLFQQYPTFRNVIVNTQTDRAFRGVLWRKRAGYMVLINSEMLKPDGQTAVVDGELVIERENIDFMQVLS